MGLDLKQIILILLIVLLLFGAKRIPELARKLGEGINEFKKGLSPSPENENLNFVENSEPEVPEKDITPQPKALPKKTTSTKKTTTKSTAKKSSKTTKTAKASTQKSRKA